MRRLVRCLPIVLAAFIVAAPVARVAPAPPPPTPIGVFDLIPPVLIVDPIAGRPVGDSIGVAVLGLGRLVMPPGTSFELTGPQVLAVAVGFPIAAPVIGAATIGQVGGAAGDLGPDELAEGRRGRLGPGDWLFVAAGHATVIESGGAADIVVFVAVVGN